MSDTTTQTPPAPPLPAPAPPASPQQDAQQAPQDATQQASQPAQQAETAPDVKLPAWLVTAQQAAPQAVPEAIGYASKLPDDFHETMRLKLSGVPTKEIARRMKCDRTTVYRRTAAVENEFMEYLEGSTSLSIIACELQRLDRVEAEAWKMAEQTKSDRQRDAALNTARRAIMARMTIYLKSGLVDQAPERIYQQVLSLKPSDITNPDQPEVSRPRPEIVGDLIKALEKCRLL